MVDISTAYTSDELDKLLQIYSKEILEKYPLSLLERRPMIEGNMIACLWKNVDLYSDLKDLAISDFTTKDGQFYFKLGQVLYAVGYKVFDAISVMTYLSDKQALREAFELRGGHNSVNELMGMVDLENTDAYYDEIVKSNILLNLYEKGFDVIKELPKFNKMNSEDVYKYFDYQLNNIFLKKQIGIKPVDLTTGYDDFLADCDSGANLGTPFNSACPLLSYHFAGIHDGTLLLHTAHSGVGKTSSAISWYILPLLEQGKKIVVIANEQNCKDWQAMLLPTVISNKLHQFKFPRQRMQYGKFTSEEWDLLKQAKAWLKQYEGNLLFVQLFDYSISTIKKIVHKYSKLGFDTFLYDTAKPEDETSDKSWAVFTENSKELFQIANTEQIKMICTAQLAMGTINTRYLNGSCLAKSKAIKEVAGQMVLMRNLWSDEYTGEGKDCKAFNYMRDESTGKWTNSKQYITLNPDKKYVVCFVDKNRFGKDGFCLLYEVNLDFNTWKEIGMCTIHQM